MSRWKTIKIEIMNYKFVKRYKEIVVDDNPAETDEISSHHLF